jgi:SAM-dependent methyltransferase
LPIIGRRFTLFPANVEYGDIVKGLPISAESCDTIYSSHTLEHLALADLRRALKNTHSYLKPGGVFRFVMPDLEYCARKYLMSGDALDFIKELELGRTERVRGLRLIREWLGNSHHLWMWDFRSISSELSDVGFNQIRRAEFGDNPLFHDIEDEGRWLNCLGVQAARS